MRKKFYGIFEALPQGFPGGSAVKNPFAMQEPWVQSLASERSPAEVNDNPLQ